MNSMIITMSLVLFFSNNTIIQNCDNANIQEVTNVIAIVTVDNLDGNYIQFTETTGGFWLESNNNHPNFEEGQILRLTIIKGELIEIESLGFIDINEQSICE